MALLCCGGVFTLLHSATIGELDEIKDKKVDLKKINAPPVKPVTH